MAIYLIVTPAPLLGTQSFNLMKSLYPDSRAVADNVWAVRSEASTREISESLFPRGSAGEEVSAPRHVVFRTDAWFGWHARDLWEWITKSA
jgi:hypothetical protein